MLNMGSLLYIVVFAVSFFFLDCGWFLPVRLGTQACRV